MIEQIFSYNQGIAFQRTCVNKHSYLAFSKYIYYLGKIEA